MYMVTEKFFFIVKKDVIGCSLAYSAKTAEHNASNPKSYTYRKSVILRELKSCTSQLSVHAPVTHIFRELGPISWTASWLENHANLCR